VHTTRTKTRARRYTYDEIGGAPQLLVVIERILATGRAPATLGGVITTFASSLLSACASTEVVGSNCSCTRSLEGETMYIESRRNTAAGHEANPKFPSGDATLPSATLPEHFSSIPGTTYVGASSSSCVDVYYVENRQARALKPEYSKSGRTLSGTSIALGVAGVANPLLPAGEVTRYRVAAPSRFSPACTHWDGSSWTSRGCVVESDNGDGELTCACDSLGSQAYTASSNDEDTVPVIVLYAAGIDAIAALALFSLAVFSDAVRNASFSYGSVAAHYGASIVLAQLFWLLSLTLTSDPAASDGTLFFIGMVLHYSAVAASGVTVATLLFVLTAGYRGKYESAKRATRWSFPAVWVGSAALVLVYVVVALDQGDSSKRAGDIYGDALRLVGVVCRAGLCQHPLAEPGASRPLS